MRWGVFIIQLLAGFAARGDDLDPAARGRITRGTHVKGSAAHGVLLSIYRLARTAHSDLDEPR
jgi:hypothetical protein